MGKSTNFCRSTRLINKHSIDILCLQECKVESGFKNNILSFKDYQLELDSNSVKSRAGIYINNRIAYTRRLDLEGQDSLV